MRAGREPPNAALLAQRTTLESAGDQLVEKQGIAERALGDLSQRHGVNRPTEHGQEQVLNCRSTEGTELDPGCAMVLPQHDHGIDAGLGGAAR